MGTTSSHAHSATNEPEIVTANGNAESCAVESGNNANVLDSNNIDASRSVSCGIGVSFLQDADGVKRVHSVGASSPCFNLIHYGDIIEKIDGEPVTSMEWSEFGNRLTGPEGSTIRLTVRSKFCPRFDSIESEAIAVKRPQILTCESCLSVIPCLGDQSTRGLALCFDEWVDEIVVSRAKMPAAYFSGRRLSASEETVKGIVELARRMSTSSIQ